MTNKLYKLMNWPAIEEIIYSEADNPHALLGPHTVGNQTLVQAYCPGAAKTVIKFRNTGEEKEMELADDDGFFAVLLPGKKVDNYYYEVTYHDGTVMMREEAYNNTPVITKADTEKFALGIHYQLYDVLGAHPMCVNGMKGVHFAVWAPNAVRVSVVGDFNLWDGRVHQMRRLWDSGIFEIFIPAIACGEIYKFEIKVKGGLTYLKADPYAFGQQLRPDTASVVRDIHDFIWEDEAWLQQRQGRQQKNAPISVYELYLGSFAKTEQGSYLNYRELAPKIIAYVKETGYTHIELMPVMEHPYDGSWGYQVIGYYAPTARYGTAEDFMYFMNEMHKANIGVILDWVPAHFPRDTYGLSNFDGTCLYEHLDPRQGSHPHWGTLIYNYGRPQVSNYLIANALYWAEIFHADGIRMDAVASMLYLDYGKDDGEWVANMYGGNENLEAEEMLKHLNSMMKKRNPGVLTIAEESTAWPMVTGRLNDGGLGFDLKWNMGFMNDYLKYIVNDPYFRSYHHGELTFSMIYAYSENFMLVFSHDEVVHGKSSMLGKMPGEREDKFANLRTTYAYMMTHPGKKLLFMGQDIGEFDEWNEERCVEWELLSYESHKGLHRLVTDLNHLYTALPALSELDDSPEGFAWINSISADESYLSYMRKGSREEDTLVVLANFAGVEHKKTIGVPLHGKFKEILNTDAEIYGGQGRINSRVKRTKEAECDGYTYSLDVRMAPLSVSIWSYQPYTEEELAKMKAKAEEKAAQKIKKEKKPVKADKPIKEKSKTIKAEKPVKAEKSAKEIETKKRTAKK